MISKFLSLVLRHQPERLGLRLDAQGWVSVSGLLSACVAHDFPLTLEELRTATYSSARPTASGAPITCPWLTSNWRTERRAPAQKFLPQTLSV